MKPKHHIWIGSGIIGVTFLWDRLFQFAEWVLRTFGHPDTKLGVYAQVSLVIGLIWLGRGIYLIGKESRENEELLDQATRPEKK